MHDVITNFRELTRYVLDEVNRYTSMNLNGLGFSEEELLDKKEQIQTIALNIRKSCSGDLGARELTKEVIRDKIEQVITEKNLENYILFDEFATPWTMFEAIVYRVNHPITLENQFKFKEARTNPLQQGKKVVLREDLGSIKAFFNAFPNALSISEKELRQYYDSHDLQLDYSDKIRILTQMVFASIYGLGVIDTLNYQQDTIEEIHIGMAGVLNQSYDYRSLMRGKTEQLGNHAKDKVHVVVNGRTIALKFLSFTDNHELKRVIRNLIKDASAGDLTEANPKIITDTIDGRRITVARPPFQDSWGGLIRKFGTVSVVNLEGFDPDCEINPIVRLFARSGANIGVTGGMEVGKTTLLRTLLRETEPDKNIRVIERDSFELNVRSYLPGRNASSYKIDDHSTEEEVSAFVRKTTGHIFSVGEVNSLETANILCNIAKVVPQVFWTSHHNKTEEMVADFKNAKLAHGFSSERLAELEAAQIINLNIRLARIDGVPRIVGIDEVIPEIGEMLAPTNIEEGLDHIQKQLNKTSVYKINPIFRRLSNGKYKKLNSLSPALMNKAKGFMSIADYIALKEWNDDIPGRQQLSTSCPEGGALE